MATVVVPVPLAFLPYVEAAVLRFSYLKPAVIVERGASTVSLSDDRTDGAALRRDFLHLVYRERIYAETLELRKEAKARIAAFDIVEFVPERDVAGLGALTAARIIANVLGLMERQAAPVPD